MAIAIFQSLMDNDKIFTTLTQETYKIKVLILVYTQSHRALNLQLQ